MLTIGTRYTFVNGRTNAVIGTFDGYIQGPNNKAWMRVIHASASGQTHPKEGETFFVNPGNLIDIRPAA